MLFKLEDGKDFFELNPSAKAIAEFNGRTSQQMWFVALVADYESPLRQLPELRKREKAAEIAGYKREPSGRGDKNFRDIVNGNVQSVELAIQKYKELQYDEDQDMLEAINRQIQEAIYFSKLDKLSVCTIETTKRFKDGSVEKTKKVDTVAMSKLALESAKLVKSLPELRAKKKELIAQINSKASSAAPLVSSSLSELEYIEANEPDSDSVETSLSTLDQYMLALRLKAESNNQETDDI